MHHQDREISLHCEFSASLVHLGIARLIAVLGGRGRTSGTLVWKRRPRLAYPRLGQSEQQAAKDRYECHRWAVSQTGFDPNMVSGAVPQGKYADYGRAISACLDARGYTDRQVESVALVA